MKKLSQIVDLKKIKVVNKNIDKAHGLPNECYTNNEYLSVERKKIFENQENQNIQPKFPLASLPFCFFSLKGGGKNYVTKVGLVKLTEDYHTFTRRFGQFVAAAKKNTRIKGCLFYTSYAAPAQRGGGGWWWWGR